MHAIIDGDHFAYELGSLVDDNGEPLPWRWIISRLDRKIERILEAVGADSYQIYLTSDDKSNFRINAATIKPYKGHRPQTKPFHYERIRKHLFFDKGAEMIFGMEADDALGIAQYPGLGCLVTESVICSRDKDLHMIPGLHYEWGCGNQNEKKLWWQSEIEALRCFYSQLLTGDTTDNIPGLYGVGPSSSLVQHLHNLDSELLMVKLVQREYERRFGSYWRMFLEENAKLLWILRTNDQDEIIKRLDPMLCALDWKKKLESNLKSWR